MKKTRSVLLGLLVLAAPAAVEGQFSYWTNNSVITLSGYNGTGGAVVISNFVTSIGSQAFSECTNLTSITIPGSVASIGEEAFYACSYLTNAFLGNGVASIGGSAFEACVSLISVTIPGSVSNIGGSAFEVCVSLNSVAIPSRVKSIAPGTFGECFSLSSVTIPNGVTSIGTQAFTECTSLRSVTIPGSVSDIGEEAFYACSYLTNAFLSNGVASIGDWAFSDCTNLSSVMIPNGVTNIGNGAFEDCASLTNITIPGSVASIGSSAFSGCTSLTNVFFQGDAPSVGSAVFAGDTNGIIYYLPGTAGWSSVFAGLPAVILAGSLQVTISPAGAVSAGAQWRVDGGAWQNSGATVINLSLGNHTVSFGTVSGWTTPSYQTVSVSFSSTTTNSGTYVEQFGSLLVTITPAAAVSAGAQWEVDGGTLQDSGATLTNLAVGNHTVGFSTIPGWTSPANQIVAVKSNLTVTATGIYVQQFGSLQVNISPPSAITAGAKWQVDGGTLQNSGATVSGLSVGNHAVSFSTVSGWMTPANQILSVSANLTASASGTYVAIDSLQVTISPAGAISAGAKWGVDGGAWQNSGATVTNLAVGNHTVSFSMVGGWTTPSNQTVSVSVNSTAAASGAYVALPQTLLTYTTNAGAITITGYIGSDIGPGSALTIPASINGLPVTSIGADAFDFCTNLMSLTIPGSVTNVGDGAFENCSNLFFVYFQGNAPVLDPSVFNSDENVTVYFQSAAAGLNFTYSDSGVSITGYSGPGGAVTIPTSINGLMVTSIGWEAFYNHSGLTSVMIPNSVTSIGADAFFGCTKLTNVTISNGVTSIGESAFAGCTNLTSVKIPASVTNIGEYAFGQCTGLTGVYFQGNAPTADSTVFTWYYYGSREPLPNATVYYLTGATGWNSTFGGLRALLWDPPVPFGYTVSNGTISIADQIGSGGAVIIPSEIDGLAVTSIGDYAFSGTSLTSITIPNSVTEIGQSAFQGCTGLSSIAIPASVTNWGTDAFESCTGLTNITFANGLTSIGEYAFDGCSSLASVTIPGSVTNIGNYAFYYCTGLTSITMANWVTSIGGDAFGYCTKLTSVTIPASVTIIGAGPFAYCTSLTTITVDSNNPAYSSVNGVLFDKSQTTLIQCPPDGIGGSYKIPATVTNISDYAFSGCHNLTEVYFQSNAPSADCTVFQGDNVIVYYLPGTTGWGVTFACVSAEDEYGYATNAGAIAINRYSGPGGAVTIPDFIGGLPVNSIGSNVFAGTSLTSVTIPIRVTSIGDSAFAGTALIGLAIPSSVTNIGDCAFKGCASLADIAIPDSVTSIGEGAFENCGSLTGVTIPGGVTTIQSNTFNGCSRLANAIISGGVTNIGDYAFEYCTNLTAVIFQGNAPSADCTVFDYDYKVTVYYSPGTTGWGATFACVPTALLIFGSLQVIITPTAAITAGAEWEVDGGTLQNSGATVTNLAVGNHTVGFSTIPGWTTPTNQTVSVKSNLTATASGVYVQQFGSLQVTISPASAITAGVQWQVDGGKWENSGATVSGLAVGNHTVGFDTVSGWITPASQTVAVSDDSTAIASGTYAAKDSLQVTITPAAAISAGAQWQVDAGPLQNSGATVTNLSAGSHTISFSTVSGWTTPTNQTITVTANSTIRASGTYVSQPGSLQVTINPGAAITAGAKWQVDGGAFHASGASVTNLSAGKHSVSFNAISGWSSPSNQSVTITSGQMATLTVSYLDTSKPTLSITSPTANQRWSNSTFTVEGLANDNVAVASVYYQLNSNGWTTATMTNGGSNWTANVTLLPGGNVLRAYSEDTSGNNSTTNKVSFQFIPSATLIVQTNGLGGITPVDNGKLMAIGTNYTLTASPGHNWLFSNWVGGTTLPYAALSPSSNYTFTMQPNLVLEANFVTNPFLAVAGVYNGLFYPASGLTEASSGFISVAIASNSTGAYSAKLLLDGGSNSFSGSFDLTGTAQTNLTRNAKTPVSVTLSLDFNPAEALMGGSVSNAAAGWNSVIQADRAVFSTTANPATNYAGQFTLLLPPDITAPVGSPDGYGYAAITNTLEGISTLGGALADGTPFLWSVPIARNGGVPLYQSLYSGKGSLLGWIYFTNEPPQNVSTNSSVSWIRPSVPNTLYPSGFTNLIANGVLGSPYKNTAGVPVLNLTNATLVLRNGNLKGAALIFTNLNSAKNTLTNLAGGTKLGETNYLVLAINTNNGVVTVTFQATGAKPNTVAHGAVLQNETNAAGYFLGTNQSGAFILDPR